MRRGYRNRWAHDNSPTGDSNTKPLETTVNPETGLWHHTGRAVKVTGLTQAQINKLEKYGWKVS